MRGVEKNESASIKQNLVLGCDLEAATPHQIYEVVEPEINTSYLICHTLGAGNNYDVGCYLGKDKHGITTWLFNEGIEVLHKHIIKIFTLPIEVEDDAQAHKVDS